MDFFSADFSSGFDRSLHPSIGHRMHRYLLLSVGHKLCAELNKLLHVSLVKLVLKWG